MDSVVFNDGFLSLLGYQARWNRESAEIALCEKSRRIGISWGDAMMRVIYASEGHGNIYYMSYNKDMTETYIGDCAAWAQQLGAAASEVFEEHIIGNDREQVLTYRITFDSGKFILALPSNPRVLRSKGKPGDIVVIDEAAFCDDLPELLKAALAITQWGGKVRIISTHNGEDNPFNELIRDVRAGRYPDFVVHRITLDDAIADGLARRICSVKNDAWSPDYAANWRAAQIHKYPTTDMADEELLCIPRQGGGAYFPRVLVESCMVDAPVLRFNGSREFNQYPEPVRRADMADWLHDNVLPLLAELVPECRHVLGMDFARSGDLSVIAPLELGETLKRRCPFLVEMHNVPHLQQVQTLTYIGDRLPRFNGGAIDAGGNGSFIAEAAVDHFGSIIEGIHFTEAWYREQMPKYKAAFEDGMISIPRHDDILQDHRALRLVRGVPRLPQGKTDSKGMRHGDAAIALALAWYAGDSEQGPIEFESVGACSSNTLGAAYLGGMDNLQGFI